MDLQEACDEDGASSSQPVVQRISCPRAANDEFWAFFLKTITGLPQEAKESGSELSANVYLFVYLLNCPYPELITPISQVLRSIPNS